jgi:hypothetical protein
MARILKEPTKLQGRISCSRNNHDEIHIELEDVLSGCIVVEAKLDLETFAKLVTGQGFLPCEFKYFEAPIGMKREGKYELVPVPPSAYMFEKNPLVYTQWLAPFMDGGWKPYVPDLFNHHNTVTKDGQTYQRVGFSRHVAP